MWCGKIFWEGWQNSLQHISQHKESPHTDIINVRFLRLQNFAIEFDISDGQFYE